MPEAHSCFMREPCSRLSGVPACRPASTRRMTVGRAGQPQLIHLSSSYGGCQSCRAAVSVRLLKLAKQLGRQGCRTQLCHATTQPMLRVARAQGRWGGAWSYQQPEAALQPAEVVISDEHTRSSIMLNALADLSANPNIRFVAGLRDELLQSAAQGRPLLPPARLSCQKDPGAMSMADMIAAYGHYPGTANGCQQHSDWVADTGSETWWVRR